jgi:glutamate--cysteine ligase
MPMRHWLARRGPRPDDADLDHHLTTLFPPVRPRGYLEVRYLDALPGRWVPVPVCLLATLAVEPSARRRALEALDAPGGAVGAEAWWCAAGEGITDPGLRRTAADLFDIALAGMRRLEPGYLPPEAPALVAEYRERYVGSGRCPADDLLERHLARPEELTTWM